ncbi:uncharacterized protein BCR38DRAFT_19523 [Pseudomassariella vexata]|uniref:Uncharacterized protein n=1 Tax=Pseudomassariella vexata TaxID=1141098 RepID=A0A1Y2EJN4_9PEZI|nr:uncharacterized protein BCR38DRAFT_19523 [Pseudomassariella vexata]ORY71760.1 hypothetical protein BCR38DRAFT_19523 [Pseudomassariella vexata]
MSTLPTTKYCLSWRGRNVLNLERSAMRLSADDGGGQLRRGPGCRVSLSPTLVSRAHFQYSEKGVPAGCSIRHLIAMMPAICNLSPRGITDRRQGWVSYRSAAQRKSTNERPWTIPNAAPCAPRWAHYLGRHGCIHLNRAIVSPQNLKPRTNRTSFGTLEGWCAAELADGQVDSFEPLCSHTKSRTPYSATSYAGRVVAAWGASLRSTMRKSTLSPWPPSPP